MLTSVIGAPILSAYAWQSAFVSDRAQSDAPEDSKATSLAAAQPGSVDMSKPSGILNGFAPQMQHASHSIVQGLLPVVGGAPTDTALCAQPARHRGYSDLQYHGTSS